MVKRTFRIIKKNPLIAVLYIVFTGLNLVMSGFMNSIEDMALNPVKVESAASKMLGMWIIIIVICILFTGGFGNMVGTAVIRGKCSVKDFLDGINYFLWRMLLSFMLLSFMALSFLLVIIIAAFPILMAVSLGGIRNTGAVAAVITIITGIFTVFVSPAVMLWYPSMFIDDTGVMEGIKRGFRVSRKCYWYLAAMTLILILPSFVYTTATAVISGEAYGSIASGITSGYIISMLVNLIISLVVFVNIFIVYDINAHTALNKKDI